MTAEPLLDTLFDLKDVLHKPLANTHIAEGRLQRLGHGSCLVPPDHQTLSPGFIPLHNSVLVLFTSSSYLPKGSLVHTKQGREEELNSIFIYFQFIYLFEENEESLSKGPDKLQICVFT